MNQNHHPYGHWNSGPFHPLSKLGLNLCAIFNLEDIPESAKLTLHHSNISLNNFHQLVLFGHGGRTLWSALSKHPPDSNNPVDDYCVETVRCFLAKKYPEIRYQILYPGPCCIDLQSLGKLAGWHHNSPFKVGINAQWGTWFAYRLVLLADSDFPVSPPIETPPPCSGCLEKPCIKACPANAFSEIHFSLDACSSYRLQTESSCQFNCLARSACPVGREHRYSKEQSDYHYDVSLRTLKMLKNASE